MSERRPGATLEGSVRIVRCPACEHEGVISKVTPSSARLRCRACGERWLVREATGPHPCRRKSTAKRAKSAAAKEVLARYGELPEDTVVDLWRPAST